MSFIKIIEEKNPIEMHNKVYEASKNNALTPEFCMEVLSHTNVPVIMGKMLEEIGKLPIEEQGEYKEVILSMFDFRQTSEKVKNKALVVAKNNGFVSELVDVIDKTRNLGYPTKFGCDKIYVIEKNEAFLHKWYFGEYYDYSRVDFSSYDCVVIRDKFTKNLCLNHNKTYRGILDLRGAKEVDLRECDLSKVTKIIFGEGGRVDLSRATNLPTNLDVSMCNHVNLMYCDLSNVANLMFKDGGSVFLNGATNLPSNLDVSMCDSVNLSECDLDGLNLKFKEGSTVHLAGATNLPKDLDLSMCDKVDMLRTNISSVKELKFKNEEQMKDSQVKIPEGWGGKVIYTDDEKLAPVISKGNDGR